MDISAYMKRLLTSSQIGFLLVGVCLTTPAIRVQEPEFRPVQTAYTYKRGEQARLLCSIKHLGERIVSWRKTTDKNPLTIASKTWVDDPRIRVDHEEYGENWDLLISDVTPDDSGEYECQFTVNRKKLRQVVNLTVTENSGTVKRNPDILISGTQFVSHGQDINLFCNASTAASPGRSLVWFKDMQEVEDDGERISLTTFNPRHREQFASQLRIERARADDSGLYICRSADELLMTSAHVHVSTEVSGSNNVKRAGSVSSLQESKAVLTVRLAISNSTFVFVILLVHRLFT
ncbi:hemicentin-2-like [Physella acuta]|uniref:hemicentin-2-like n=1 Tax=Physella acuta TaxID=109671 RepID=UPI0027DC1481|nr:hemicentin-2-like [Physella acuta]